MIEPDDAEPKPELDSDEDDDIEPSGPNSDRTELTDEVALCAAVTDVRRQVLVRLPLLVEEPRLMLTMTKSLRDLTVLSNAMVRRVEGALSTASTLRASRRMFAIQHRVEQ